MAVVYLAHDAQHDRQVALKVLRPELAAVIGPDRFLAEIRTTANLQHPHILALFDSGRVDGTVYYVMPFVEGESLRHRLDREKQLPVDDAVRIAREVAAALDYAHRHGVIHRDIKPENILLHDGQALVADFGIALAASRVSDTRMTETGMSLGTPMYMSPEQAMGERNLDARTDVYALGCVLFEMLSGEPPFTGPTAQAVVARVLTDQPRRLSSLRRSVPPHVEEAVEHALEKLPADRFGSAREFADILSDPARTSGRRYAAATARSELVRHPLVVGLATAVATLGAVVLWLIQRETTPPPSPSVRFSVELPADTRLAVFALTGANMAISPDGRTIILAAEGPDGIRRLYQRRSDELELEPIRGTEGASQPSVSKDGRNVAFVATGRLLKVALDGSAPQPVTHVPISDIAGHSWMQNGGVLYPDVDGNLVLVKSSGGAPERFTSIDSASGETQQQYPVVLADGEHVLYASWGRSGAEVIRIGIANTRTGRAVRTSLAGVTPIGMVDDFIVYATLNGDLMAARVELATGRVLSQPVAVASGVMIGAAGAAKAALSASGNLVYLGGARPAQLVLVDLSGGGSTPVISEPRIYGYPRYSPNGRQIAVTIATGPLSDVWLYDVASRTQTRLTIGGTINERVEWTPDGSRVLFRSDRQGNSSIWSQRADQTDSAVALLLGQGRFFEAVISPDAKHIVFQVDTNGSNIEYRLMGDSVSKPVVVSSGLENMPRLSPDGRWLAFVTDESGSRQVMVQPFPGPGPRVQVSTNGGAEPVWSRDGRRIFYRGLQKVIAASVVATPTFAVVSRDELFEDVFQQAVSPHANYDVAPDGKHLLMLKGVEQQGLIVVHNWADEVRARLRSISR